MPETPMDRNDELLLALNWVRKPSGRPDAFEWFNPAGEHVESEDRHDTDPEVKRPRPYDSVDDGIACVPEGWRTSAAFELSHGWFWQITNIETGKEAFTSGRPTAAEAIATAIAHALEYKDKP